MGTKMRHLALLFCLFTFSLAQEVSLNPWLVDTWYSDELGTLTIFKNASFEASFDIEGQELTWLTGTAASDESEDPNHIDLVLSGVVPINLKGIYTSGVS